MAKTIYTRLNTQKGTLAEEPCGMKNAKPSAPRIIRPQRIKPTIERKLAHAAMVLRNLSPWNLRLKSCSRKSLSFSWSLMLVVFSIKYVKSNNGNDCKNHVRL